MIHRGHTPPITCRAVTQKLETTLKTLAQKAKVNLPDLRNEAEAQIVHAMTINKIKIIDTKAADMYADITKTES